MALRESENSKRRKKKNPYHAHHVYLTLTNSKISKAAA